MNHIRITAIMSLAITSGALHAQEPAKRPTMATATMQAYAPTLGDYTNDVLFGDVWERPGLSKRDRSLVTVAALVTMSRQGQLERHLARALDNGVTPAEIAGLVTTLAFYSGWPSASSALDAVDKVFRERQADTGPLKAPRELLPRSLSADADERAAEQALGPMTPKLAEITGKVLIGDLWRRPDLSPRDRSLIVIAAVIAGGAMEQLPSHLRRAAENGLTRAEIGEELTHLAFYAGWPKATAAIAAANKTLGAATGKKRARP
jgi:4-carboxymuconolactone decarboxylase